MSRTIGGALMAVAALASVAVLAFAPGVGCGVNSKADIARQAKERSLGRHRIEAVSNFIQTQKKNAARIRNKKAKQAARQRAKAITPAEQTAFRTGVALGAWNRYIAGPHKGTKGDLSNRQTKLAKLAIKGLVARLRGLSESAKAARLTGLANTATALATQLPDLNAGLERNRVDPKVYARVRALVLQLRRQAADAKLKVLERVPPDFMNSSK